LSDKEYPAYPSKNKALLLGLRGRKEAVQRKQLLLKGQDHLWCTVMAPLSLGALLGSSIIHLP